MAETTRFHFNVFADASNFVRLHTTETNREYWTTGLGSQPITWIGNEPPPHDEDVIRQRVEALKRGADQWGCDGAHHGRRGDTECPEFLHHHHDYRCALPTEDECARANVEYRTTWASRA